MLVLEMRNRLVLYPGLDDAAALAATPIWAKLIVAAALNGHRARASDVT